MRYINLRLTYLLIYLLTYLLTYLHSVINLVDIKFSWAVFFCFMIPVSGE